MNITRTANDIVFEAAALLAKIGFQTFGDKTREEVDAALMAQIETIEGRLTDGEVRARYEDKGDLIFGAAVSATGWLSGDADKKPSECWP